MSLARHDLPLRAQPGPSREAVARILRVGAVAADRESTRTESGHPAAPPPGLRQPHSPTGSWFGPRGTDPLASMEGFAARRALTGRLYQPANARSAGLGSERARGPSPWRAQGRTGPGPDPGSGTPLTTPSATRKPSVAAAFICRAHTAGAGADRTPAGGVTAAACGLQSSAGEVRSAARLGFVRACASSDTVRVPALFPYAGARPAEGTAPSHARGASPAARPCNAAAYAAA